MREPARMILLALTPEIEAARSISSLSSSGILTFKLTRDPSPSGKNGRPRFGFSYITPPLEISNAWRLSADAIQVNTTIFAVLIFFL